MTTTKTISATLIPKFYSPRKRREILAQMRKSAVTGLIARINQPSPTVAEVKAQRLAEIADELQDLQDNGAFVLVSAEEVFEAEQNSTGINLTTGEWQDVTDPVIIDQLPVPLLFHTLPLPHGVEYDLAAD